ncbi:MAG: hypothetical protein ACK56F_06150, partial [bacterium]
HIAIYDEPPKFEDTFEEGFNPDTENIQFTFYNYHYGEIIREAIKFLNVQAFEYGFGTKEETPPPPIKTKPSALSFKYINLSTGSVNLTDLMNSLKRSALIHQETLLGNFRSVFSEKGIEQKIIWTGNISELAHLPHQVSFEMLRWTSALRDYRDGMEHDHLRRKLGLSKITWRETE